MKIAFVGQKGIPATAGGGGVENYVDHITVRLARKGHQVLAYTRSQYAPAGNYKGVEVIATPSIPTKTLDAGTHTLTSIWHSFFIPDLDILHINSVGPAFFTLFARIGFGLKYILVGKYTKVVFTFHSADWYHGKWNLFAKSMLKLGAWIGCNFADEVITVSKSLRYFASREFDIKTTYIPNGTDFNHITSDSELAQFGLKQKSYIVFIARLVKHKNAHILIQAYQGMARKYGKKLVIVGSGSFTPEYEAYLHSLTYGDKNIIFTGHQSGRTLKQLFANAAVYVLPSASEGLSISLLEAGSYGVPIIVSDIRENIEIVGDLAHIAKVNNIPSLRHRLEEVLGNYREAMELAEMLQAEIKYHYSWNNIVKAIENVYHRNSSQYRGAGIQVNSVLKY
ncbi:glycosyltransferase [bacterium]|nr:glycosyltransferase [Candidatus Elulimicrobium humile]